MLFLKGSYKVRATASDIFLDTAIVFTIKLFLQALFHKGKQRFIAAIQFLHNVLGQDENLETLAANGGSISIQATVNGSFLMGFQLYKKFNNVCNSEI